MTDVPDFLPVGTVRYELLGGFPDSQRCCIRRVEVIAICESREEARQWMIERSEARQAADGGTQP